MYVEQHKFGGTHLAVIIKLNVQPWWLGSLACQLSHSVDCCLLGTVDRSPLEEIIPAIDIVQIPCYGPYSPTDVCYNRIFILHFINFTLSKYKVNSIYIFCMVLGMENSIPLQINQFPQSTSWASWQPCVTFIWQWLQSHPSYALFFLLIFSYHNHFYRVWDCLFVFHLLCFTFCSYGKIYSTFLLHFPTAGIVISQLSVLTGLLNLSW